MNQPEAHGGKPESPAGFVFDERYVEAFFHVRHRVLGRALRPFSAWHRTVLEYVGSPFLTGEPVRSLGPVRLAVEVCGLRYPDLPRGRERRGWWGRLCAAADELRDARRERQAVAASAAFVAYMEDYCSLPKLHISTRKVGPGGRVSMSAETTRVPDMDETLMDVALYRTLTGCPREEPWDMPLGELIWMNAAMARTKGMDLRVLTTEEEARLERLRKKIAEAADAKGGGDGKQQS